MSQTHTIDGFDPCYSYSTGDECRTFRKVGLAIPCKNTWQLDCRGQRTIERQEVKHDIKDSQRITFVTHEDLEIPKAQMKWTEILAKIEEDHRGDGKQRSRIRKHQVLYIWNH
jgi:hypothetical protein